MLVFLVMFLFLQNIRYTLIPTIVVPIALLGTCVALLWLGFSINVLTMFGMVLAIGILVDDAIVVVENVERIMAEEAYPRGRRPRRRWSDHRGGDRHHAGADGGVRAMAFFPARSASCTSSSPPPWWCRSASRPSWRCRSPPRCARRCSSRSRKDTATPNAGSSAGFNHRLDRLTRGYGRATGWMVARAGRFMLLYLALLAGLGTAIVAASLRLRAGRRPGLRHGRPPRSFGCEREPHARRRQGGGGPDGAHSGRRQGDVHHRLQLLRQGAMTGRPSSPSRTGRSAAPTRAPRRSSRTATPPSPAARRRGLGSGAAANRQSRHDERLQLPLQDRSQRGYDALMVARTSCWPRPPARRYSGRWWSRACRPRRRSGSTSTARRRRPSASPSRTSTPPCPPSSARPTSTTSSTAGACNASSSRPRKQSGCARRTC